MKICYIFIGEIGTNKTRNAKRFAKHMHLPYCKELPDQINEQAIVISKNLYTNEQRIELKQTLEREGIQVIYYWVKISLLQNIKQLIAKPKPLTQLIRWLKLHFTWQNPTHHYRTVWWQSCGFYEES